MFENVKGLYRTVKHREFFDGLKKQLHESGYTCTERLINSIEYGAPQDRERIIFFGIRGKRAEKLADFNWHKHAPYPQALGHAWPDAQPIAIK